MTRQELVDLERNYWAKNTPVGFVFNLDLVVSLFAGSFFVYQILYTDVSKHLKEYATLKAIGYTDGRLFLVVLGQAIDLSLLGHNLLAALTAGQNVQMALGLDRRLSPQTARDKSKARLQAVGLGENIDAFPEQLSNGQRQRVAIARALVREPGIVLADEPTASLDRKSGREVVELLIQLARRQHCSILLATHDNRIFDTGD